MLSLIGLTSCNDFKITDFRADFHISLIVRIYFEVCICRSSLDFLQISSAQPMTVHWDGKMLPDLIGCEKVERIAILVSYNGTSKLLAAPKIPSSSGENIADVVLSTLLKWNISDRVAAMGFDTTASNTGDKSGACVHLQNNIDRKLLLHFACRHHIYELLLRTAFESKFGKSSGPDVPIFERFVKNWKNLNQKSFKNGLEDPIVRSKISDEECDAIKNFCHQKLLEGHIRAD